MLKKLSTMDLKYVKMKGKNLLTRKQVKRKPLKELNLTSRFLYDEVMEDAETNQAALSIILGKEIPLLMQNESEKELVDFLHYVEDTTDERAEQSGNERIRKIHERVRKVKQSEEDVASMINKVRE